MSVIACCGRLFFPLRQAPPRPSTIADARRDHARMASCCSTGANPTEGWESRRQRDWKIRMAHQSNRANRICWRRRDAFGDFELSLEFGRLRPTPNSGRRPPHGPSDRSTNGLLRTEHRHEKVSPFRGSSSAPERKLADYQHGAWRPLQHQRHRRPFVVKLDGQQCSIHRPQSRSRAARVGLQLTQAG